MPRLSFPKVTREIKLADYLPELSEQAISVWVNPPTSELRQIIDALQGEENQPVFDGMAQLWQDWTADEIKEQFEAGKEIDPDFWNWLIEATFAAINDYRDERKKAFRGRSAS
jgi:hypothetical protein